jgi:HK97 gp10 family phage protein
MIVAKVKNKFNLSKKMNQLKADVMSSSIRGVQDATFLIHETAVKLVQDNSKGTPAVRYNRSGKKRNVLVSKPGNPPNTDTGRLAQSIKFDFKKDGFVGRVGTNLRYGRNLEFGTKRMSPRPWLSTAVRIKSDEVAAIFKKALTESTKKATK